MQIPLEIEFRNTEGSAAIEVYIREHAEKLEDFFDRVTGCRVLLEVPHHHHRKGNLYHVRILVTVPRKELVVDRQPSNHRSNEEVHVAIRDAFKAMRRQLEDYVREMRGDVKSHVLPPHGRIHRVFPEAGYGFIATADGREIYFHRHAVLDDAFDKLEVGSEVRFEEEQGNEGPQASTVTLVGRYRHLAS
jgi:cold shock CspA family protein/ribosome-associated translation inhibitor RaiA